MNEWLLQCMGGRCVRREGCAHYHAPKIAGLKPAERLCRHGTEGYIPLVRATRPASGAEVSEWAAWLGALA